MGREKTDTTAADVTGTDDLVAPPVAETPSSLTVGESVEALETETGPETPEQKARRWVDSNLTHTRIGGDVELWNIIIGALPALAAIIAE